MEFLISVSIVLLAAYCLLILIYLLGWLLIINRVEPMLEAKHAFSILIPARNEATIIKACLEDIISQDYPKELFEIVVIDDCSEDETASIVEALILQHSQVNIRLLKLTELLPRGSKKEGITLGVSLAKFEHILLTDADCLRKQQWLNALNSALIKKPAQLIYAPVFFGAQNNFERIQSLEFAGLVGIGAAAIQLKNPNMCSAANLMFTKTAFNAVGGYLDNMHLASGDDEFLLHKVFKKYPNEVYFLKDKRAIVFTSPNASVAQLVQQRRRWVSKSTKYEERYITAILVGAYLFNLSIPLNLVLGYWYPGLGYLGLIQLAVKSLVEGLFLYQVCAFFGQRKLLLLLPLAEPFHIFYVLIIGIWANVKTYTWKNRTHK